MLGVIFMSGQPGVISGTSLGRASRSPTQPLRTDIAPVRVYWFPLGKS